MYVRKLAFGPNQQSFESGIALALVCFRSAHLEQRPKAQKWKALDELALLLNPLTTAIGIEKALPVRVWGSILFKFAVGVLKVFFCSEVGSTHDGLAFDLDISIDIKNVY